VLLEKKEPSLDCPLIGHYLRRIQQSPSKWYTYFVTSPKLLLDRTPTERLLGSLEQANMLQHAVVICWYDRFLGLIGDPQVRTELESTNHADRYRSDAFREMKENSDNLHLAMLEIIKALPPHWQRHLLSHFLL